MNAFYFQQWACYNKIDGKSPPYNKKKFQVWNSDCWAQEKMWTAQKMRTHQHKYDLRNNKKN